MKGKQKNLGAGSAEYKKKLKLNILTRLIIIIFRVISAYYYVVPSNG